MAKTENYYGKVIMPKKQKNKSKQYVRRNNFELPQNAAKYIAVMLASYLMGKISFFNALNPIGISFLWAFAGKGAMYYGVCLAVFMGYITSSPIFGVYSYAISIGISACAVFWCDNKDIALTEKKKAFLSAISVLIGGFVLSFVNEMSIFIMVRSVAEAFVVFAVSILMNRCIETFETGIKRKVFTDDEALSIAVVVVFVVASLSTVEIFSFPIKTAAAVFFMLCVSYKGGAAVGGAAGSLLGFILIMCGQAEYSFLCVISFAGVMSGFFGKKNRLSLVVSFAISASVPAFYMGMEQDVKGAIMALLAVGLFFAVPERWFDVLSTYTSAKNEFDENKYYIKIKEHTEREMNRLADSFMVLSDIFSPNNNILPNKETGETSKIVDKAAERVCGNCGLAMYCWKAKTAETYAMFYSMINEFEEKGVVSHKGRKFAKNCVKISHLEEVVNSCCREVKGEKMWKTRLEESRSIIKEQLGSMASIIRETAQNMDFRPVYNESIAKEIKERLKKENVVPKNVFVNEDKLGKYTVTIEGQNCGGAERCSAFFVPEISAAMGRRMELSKKECENESCVSVFEESSVFGASYVYSQVAQKDSIKSGDSFIAGEYKKGMFTSAVSDGMGTGTRAAEESGKVLSYLERLLKAGFDEETASKVINCSLMAETDGVFATLDVVSIDLRRGKARIIKNGGSCVFIIRSQKAIVVKSTSLPLGISGKGESEITMFDVEDKDIVLMITDGIADSFKESNIEKAVEEAVSRSSNIKQLCDNIIDMALLKQGGEAKDDMLAAAVKIYENW